MVTVMKDAIFLYQLLPGIIIKFVISLLKLLERKLKKIPRRSLYDQQHRPFFIDSADPDNLHNRPSSPTLLRRITPDTLQVTDFSGGRSTKTLLQTQMPASHPGYFT
jgi:hypothetical protein